jgi:hypothetical protein
MNSLRNEIDRQVTSEIGPKADPAARMGRLGPYPSRVHNSLETRVSEREEDFP